MVNDWLTPHRMQPQVSNGIPVPNYQNPREAVLLIRNSQPKPPDEEPSISPIKWRHECLPSYRGSGRGGHARVQG